MTTFRQIRSNQHNCIFSTGPKSSGSEGNARTHGLSASKWVSDEEKRLAEERLAELVIELKPDGRQQYDEVETIASASVRIERCQLEEEDWRLHRAQRAEFHWHADRQSEVMELVKRLRDRPQVIACKIRQTLRGCQWMLAEFRDLAWRVRGTTAAPVACPLDEASRRRAFDLLGLSAERRIECTPLDLPGGEGSAAEVAAHQDALIAAQIAELEVLTSEDYVALDESIRLATVGGAAPGIDHQTRLIRRYETEARRNKERALANLARLKETAARLKKEAEERERAERMDRIEREAEERNEAFWRPREPESQPHPQPPPEPQEEASAPTVHAETADSIAAPLPAEKRLTRRERKAIAAAAWAARRKAG